MGIFSALYAGVNGINSSGNVISVIGDNIANVNTVGFKASRAQFEDIMAGSGVGLGSRIAGITGEFSQGGFESTSSVTDLSIDGKGFFIMEDAEGARFYSRAGQLTINKEGFLVNSDGYKIQGFTVDDNGSLTSNVDDVVISTVPVPPLATGEITASINLDSNSTVPAAFSVNDPTGTSNFSAGITIFDSMGNSHLASVYYRKSAVNTWEYFATVDGGELDSGVGNAVGATAGVPFVCASGTLEFNTDGSLNDHNVTRNDFDFLGATLSQGITFDFGTTTDDGGEGLNGITQFGSSSSITNIAQDGYASGSLKSLEVDATGIISGNYTNGTTQQIAQIVLSSFNNETALRRVGSNNYIETLQSGPPVIGEPGSAGRGAIVASTLEQSNVDLASELIRMVVIQRGFQANSRTITTVNDLLAQLVTLGQ